MLLRSRTKCVSIVARLLRTPAPWNGASASASTPPSAKGQACIKGTRLPVAVVLDDLAAGLARRRSAPAIPLGVEGVRTATAHAEVARERIVETDRRGVA